MVNLSGVALSEAEINLLSRGLSFCHTPHHINKEDVFGALESYFRCLRLKEYFLEEDNEEEQSDAQISLCPPSTWMPPKGRDPALEIYIKRFRKDVERQVNNLQAEKNKDNLPSEERMALRHLRQ